MSARPLRAIVQVAILRSQKAKARVAATARQESLAIQRELEARQEAGILTRRIEEAIDQRGDHLPCGCRSCFQGWMQRGCSDQHVRLKLHCCGPLSHPGAAGDASVVKEALSNVVVLDEPAGVVSG